MSEHPDSTDSDAVQAEDQRICQFPVAYDPETRDFTKAGHPLSPIAGRGRPSEYCGQACVDPDGVLRTHDRATAYQRKKDLRADAGAAVGSRRERPAGRPVTSARASLAELLAQFEMVAANSREQAERIMSAAQQIVATAGDPDAAAAEVGAARRDAEAQIAAAHARADDAETDAATARRELARAEEDKTLAEGAAEDALAERDVRADEAETARAEVERVRSESADRIAVVEAAAREQVAAAQERIDEVERAAAVQITEAHDVRDAANEALRRAESGRAAAEQAAADARAEADRLRAELAATREQAREEREQLRGQVDTIWDEATNRATADRDEIQALRAELATARAEARTDREQLRADHAAEMARVQQNTQGAIDAQRVTLRAAVERVAELETKLIEKEKGNR